MSKTAVLGGYYWISIKVILETFAGFRIVKGWDISVLWVDTKIKAAFST